MIKKDFRHVLAGITQEVCGECLVKSICLRVCHRYSMVHGATVSWFVHRNYSVEEHEFLEKLKGFSEDFR